MTRDQDIERVLDHWFTEGPTQMPTRFLDDTLDRIDRAPQHRLARLLTRLPAMYPNLRFAAAAAIVLAVAGLGAAALTRTPDVGSGPPGGSGLLPASLQSGWHPVGTREHPTRGGSSPMDLDIVIGKTTITIYDFHVDVLSSASLVGPDRLQLRALNKGSFWHCQVGDAGAYSFSLSTGNERLTLTPVSDTCVERAAILTGDWTRSVLGDLAPGRHVSRLFKPFGGGTGGQFAYTVPAGWREDFESNTLLQVRVAGRDGALYVVSDVVPHGQDAACPATSAGVGQSPRSMAESLATLPGAVVTTPSPVTVGGLDGVTVDLSIAPGRTVACDAFDYPGFGGSPIKGSGQARERYVILDGGDGRFLVIDIAADDKTTLDAFIADAMPVIDTFEFTR